MMNKLDTQQMFLDNEKLIYFTMKKYFPFIYSNPQEREDYYQIGSLALLRAIENYDSSKSSFSTYAVMSIWGELKRNVREKSNIIHYSRNIVDIANNLISLYYESKINTNFEIWIAHELTQMNISYNVQIGVMNYIFKHISLNMSISDTENITVEDTIISSLNILDDACYNSYIENINNKLSDFEKQIFKYYLLGYNQPALANEFNKSQAQISRILKRIKCLTIKELYDAEYYDIAGKLLQKLFKYEYDIKVVCMKYRMNFQKLYNSDKDKTSNKQLSSHNDTYNSNNKHDELIKNIILTLECFKRDNRYIRF